ncbi:unnamed protein product, partial [Prorocentrum cordatum]
MLGLAAPGALLASVGVCGPAACEAFENYEEAAPEEDCGEEFLPLLGDGWGEAVEVALESIYADAERAAPPGCSGDPAEGGAQELEADACPPFEFEAQVPQDWTPDQPVLGRGPHGSVRVRPPQGTQGGALLRCWAGPRPELRVRVPPGGTPGDEAGQRVLFRSLEGAGGEPAWWRAPVPADARHFRHGGYFCARLPPPGLYQRQGGTAGAAEGPQGGTGESGPARSADPFAAFAAFHGRRYPPGSAEYRRRQALFERRAGEAARQNARRGRIWTASVNYLSDWRSCGSCEATALVNSLPRAAAPQQPKNQGACGSCWAIAAATIVEAYAQKGNLANAGTPSVQQLASCVLNPDKCGGGGGCKGATMNLALDYALSHEIYSEAQWPYEPSTIPGTQGTAVRCSASGPALQVLNLTAAAGNGTVGRGTVAAHATGHALNGVAIPFSSYRVLPRNQYAFLLEALYETGPVGVSVAAGQWFNYGSGIFDDCTGSAGAVVDHAVVAVAFGEQAGTKYWTLMNSWGYDWGENGYIRLLRRDNDSAMCA